MRYTVRITDADGAVVRMEDVWVPEDRSIWPTNFLLAQERQGNLTDIDMALWIAAPSVCPWDCGNCRD